MTTPTPDLRFSPVGPWGVAVSDVQDLCTDIPIPDMPDERGPVWTTNVHVQSVRGFITDVSLLVTGVLGDLPRITDKARQEYIQDAAKAVVRNGAASYTEAAAHPTTTDPNATDYAQVLWNRYEAGLAALQQVLNGWIVADTGVTPPTGTGRRALGYFPPPTMLDRRRW